MVRTLVGEPASYHEIGTSRSSEEISRSVNLATLIAKQVESGNPNKKQPLMRGRIRNTKKPRFRAIPTNCEKTTNFSMGQCSIFRGVPPIEGVLPFGGAETN